MSILYKKSNWLWPTLIRHRLTHHAWMPLVHLSRWANVRSRKRIMIGEPAPIGELG
jgi:hypothetical protein